MGNGPKLGSLEPFWSVVPGVAASSLTRGLVAEVEPGWLGRALGKAEQRAGFMTEASSKDTVRVNSS